MRCRHGVVADVGMLSAGNLKELDEVGLRFIIGPRVSKGAGRPGQPLPLARGRVHRRQLIDTITPRVATAAAGNVNDPSKRAEPVYDPKVHTRSWRAVWANSRKRAVRDGKTLTLQENGARAVVDDEKAARTTRFILIPQWRTPMARVRTSDGGMESMQSDSTAYAGAYAGGGRGPALTTYRTENRSR